MKQCLSTKCAFAALAVSCVSAIAQTNELVFEDQTAGLSLQLPAGWVEFPKETLHRVAGRGAKLEPTPPPREFLAAFQRASDVERATFPRIILHVQKSARIDEKQFRGLHAAPLVEITVAESLGFAGRPKFMRSARYNPDKLCLEFYFDCYIEDIGFVRAAGRSFLTRDGLVNIYGYAPGNDFDTFKPEFEKILSTFELTPGHSYQPGTADQQSGSSAGESLKKLVLVIGAIVLSGIVTIVYWRMREQVWSDEV